MTSRVKRHLRQAERAIQRMMLSRACGTCTACCTTQGVAELKKPAGVPCEHLSEKKGCGIYARRPPSCAEWSCAWRMGLFDGADRPDRTGVVIDLTERNDVWPDNFAFIAREAFPGGFEKAETFLNRLADERVTILILPGGMRRVIGPPADVAFVNREIAFAEYDRPRRHLPMFDPKKGEL